MKELFDDLGTCKIGGHSVFSFLCDENMSELSAYFSSRTIRAGETLWKEGDPCDYVGIISSGQIDVKKETEFEGKHVVVGIYKKGAVIGSLCILDNSMRVVTAVAREDSTLVVISRENFERLIADNPVLGCKLLKGMLLSVSVRLRKAYERMTTFF
ncbi:MAG: cyclic nucleotide-binding domain-containing protein [Nitrospiraceae bacterium]|nr:MAG: cyclic nucleotide-binding domain-containing protein [Nitrospiraceae bacterium]